MKSHFVFQFRPRFLLGLLGVLLATYIAAVFVPSVFGMQVTGFQGKLVDARFEVTRVAAGSAADGAGLQRGDILEEADGRALCSRGVARPSIYAFCVGGPS